VRVSVSVYECAKKEKKKKKRKERMIT